MAEVDLKNAVKDILEREGAFQKMKAEMRSHVYNALVEPDKAKKVNQPECKDFILANEIIREYLEWYDCKFTMDVFDQECKFDKKRLSRNEILHSLRACDTPESTKLPILLGIISSFKDEVENS